MTEEPNTLTMRFPRKKVLKEDENTITIVIDDAIGFLRQLMTAFTNPNMAVAEKGDEE